MDDDAGATPIVVAAESEWCDLVQLLASVGADINRESDITQMSARLIGEGDDAEGLAPHANVQRALEKGLGRRVPLATFCTKYCPDGFKIFQSCWSDELQAAMDGDFAPVANV